MGAGLKVLDILPTWLIVKPLFIHLLGAPFPSAQILRYHGRSKKGESLIYFMSL